MQSQEELRKRALPIFVMFTIMPVLLLFVVRTGAKTPAESSSMIIAYVGGAVGLVIAGFLARVKLRPEVPVRQFMSDMVVCLGASEFAALLGVFLIGPSSGVAPLPLIAGTLAMNLLVIAPKVLSRAR